MFRPGRLGFAAVAIAASFVLAPNALAATEVGNNCEGNVLDTNYSRFNIERETGATMPVSAPSDGVVTKWKVNAMAPASSFPELLKVIRPTADTYKFGIVGESRVELVQSGPNSFDTRIPVKAGDDFGVVGFPAVELCTTTGVRDLVSYIAGNPPVGTTQTFNITSQLQAAVSVIVEPDADGDGYGDETQDKCPQSASYQGTCPTVPAVTLKTRSKVREHAILVWARPSGQATVDSYGQVGWGYKPNPKLKTAGAKPKRLIVGLSGPKKEVFPGASTKFRIGLPRLVLERLAKLAPRESLVAKLTLRATNLANVSKNTRLRVKLKGPRYWQLGRRVRSLFVATLRG